MAGLIVAEIIAPAIIVSLHLAASAGASAPYSGGKLVGLQTSGDLIRGGRGSISGTVKRDADPADLPLRRRVRLHRDVDGMMLRETWSDATTGAYLFTDIDPTITYTIISYDHEHNYRAVAADNITPEVLP